MNTTTRNAFRPWPGQVELRNAGDRHVACADGTDLDLNAFRDACRTHAADLRKQAIAQAGRSLRAVIGKALKALARAPGHRRAVASGRGVLGR